jgi:outer membrane protein OmpA-like peptidoglycan-associated protein
MSSVEQWKRLATGDWNRISLFKYNSTNITVEIAAVLDRFAAVLEELPKIAKFRITGYTDNTGTIDDNMDLGLWRAMEVRDYLVEKYGFDPERFAVESGGQQSPVGNNDSAQGRAMNRRVEIKLIVESLTSGQGTE